MLTSKTKKIVLSTLALGVASAAIVFGSFAAWTAQTTNPGNSVTTGTLGLTNDKDAAAVITATGVIPGGTGSSTVKIKNTGANPLIVKLTQSAVVQNASNFLQIRIHDGTNCVYPAATGACTAWGAWNGASTINGLNVGTFAAAQEKTYTVSYQLDANSTNTDQNKTNTFALTWDGTLS